MLPTPYTTHVDGERTYVPAEDSFLFLDTLSSEPETHFLRNRFGLSSGRPTPLIVEVGTGSGIILAFITAHAQTLFGTSQILTVGTDVNRYACVDAQQTVRRTLKDTLTECSSTAAQPAKCWGEHLAIFNGDLTCPLRSGVVDLLLFNPPYVPSSNVPSVSLDRGTGGSDRDLDKDAHMLDLSYEGGLDGMEVTQRFLDQLPLVLNKERGAAYVLLCKQNRPEEVIQRLRDNNQWEVDVVARSGSFAGWEKLQIIRIAMKMHLPDKD